MYLFTVVAPLAIQVAVSHAVPPGLPTKYAYERDVTSDASLTISNVLEAPTVGIYIRDVTSSAAGTTDAHRIPPMPPLDQPYVTITVTHTTTNTGPPMARANSTTTIMVTRTKTTTLPVKCIATGHSNTTNASLNGTVHYNTLPKSLKTSTDNKCGAKVGQTCINHPEGRCCSRYRYCGGTDAHCGAGCQSGFGVCGAEGLGGKSTKSTALKSIKSLAPLLDRVLVQRIKAQTQTAGGIFLPESSVKELNEARVLAVGPGGLDKEGKNVKPSVRAGDKVLIPQYGGSPVKVGEEEYALFRDYELLAKINE
ncbi:hypothetical protein V493_08481 [Pseudogymnoascus sp. VKM F-4281 (FW-2241)]|nr:hypothetical protein V493_08481 [Pseudogymnoascus sp. VKM F-4281 (FW-2241)]